MIAGAVIGARRAAAARPGRRGVARLRRVRRADVGHTCAGLVPAATVVTRWFHVKRSVALSIASTGSVGRRCADHTAREVADGPQRPRGLRRRGSRCIWFVGIVPVTLLFMRPDPQSLGWEPDGIRTDAGPPREYFSVDAPRCDPQPLLRHGLDRVHADPRRAGRRDPAARQARRGTAGELDRDDSPPPCSPGRASSPGWPAGRSLRACRWRASRSCAPACRRVALVVIAAVRRRRCSCSLGIVLFGATIGNLLMLHPLLIGQEFGPRDYAQIFSRSQFVAFVGTAAGPVPPRRDP